MVKEGVEVEWRSEAEPVAHTACPLSQIREDIQALTEEDGELLLRDLLLEPDGPPDEDVERARMQEIHRRLKELGDGSVEAILAEEVFERLRSRLAE